MIPPWSDYSLAIFGLPYTGIIGGDKNSSTHVHPVVVVHDLAKGGNYVILTLIPESILHKTNRHGIILVLSDNLDSP